MAQIFLSHASENADAARLVANVLRGAGVHVWIAPDSILPGQVYNEAIVAGLRACEALAVLVSRAANASKHVEREVALADNLGKRILPIRIESVEPSDGLAYYLNLPQWIEWHAKGPPALAPLIALMGGAAQQPPPQAPSAPPAAPLRTPTPSIQPTTASGAATLQIHRPRVLSHSARKLALLVDGQKVGEISNGQTVLVQVAPGLRQISAKVDYIKSEPIAVEIAPGQTASLEIKPAELSDLGSQFAGLVGSSSYFKWTRVS